MFCTNCGSAIPEGAKFCTNCGAVAPVSFNAAEPAPEAPAEEAIPDNTAAETVSETAEQVTETPVNTDIPDTVAGAAGGAASDPRPPRPQGTWYDQPYTMSQNQVNEGNYYQQQQQAANTVDAKESFKNPSFGEAIQSLFLRYVDFKGRSSRAEYWYVVLASYLIGIAFGILIKATNSGIFATIEGFYSFLIFIPSLAIWVRRLHDTGRSGWFVFIMLIPIVGWILMLVWLCSGSDGSNIYGPEPRMK